MATLKEEKEKIFSLMGKIDKSYKKRPINELLHLLELQKIEDAIKNYLSVVNDVEEVRRVVGDILDGLEGDSETPIDSNINSIEGEPSDGQQI